MGVAPKFTNPSTSGLYCNVMGIPNLHMKKNPDDSDTSPPSATGLLPFVGIGRKIVDRSETARQLSAQLLKYPCGHFGTRRHLLPTSGGPVPPQCRQVTPCAAIVPPN